MAGTQAGLPLRVSLTSRLARSLTRSISSSRVKPMKALTFFIWLTATTRLILAGQLGPARHVGDHQAAGVLLLREQRGLLQVLPFGDQQFDRIPGGELLPALLLGVRRGQHVGDGGGELVVGHRRQVDVLQTGHRADDLELAGELLDLFDAEFRAEPVAQRFGLLGVGARHHDDRLGGGEPQVGGAHHDQRRAGVAFVVEGVQVRVPAPALLRQLVAADRALGLGHAAAGAAGRADDRRADALARRWRRASSGRALGFGALAAAVHPQLVGELVEVAVGAGQQVLGGNRGAFASDRTSRPGPLGAAAGAASVGELRQVRAERVGVGVG